MRFLLKRSWIVTLALTFTFLAGSTSVLAQEKSPDEWQYDFEVYLWAPAIKPTLQTGQELDWSFYLKGTEQIK